MTLAKLKSKKGYIFTYEAIVVAIIFVIVFYVGHFAITHNILTVHEEKRNIESFEKANLITDVLYKQHELPSNSYIPDYKKFLDKIKERYYTSENKIPGTFDPFTQAYLNNPHNFANVPNVSSNVNLTSVNYSVIYSDNDYVKTRNLLVPIKTCRYSNNRTISENISNGEILYFAANGSSTLVYINASSTEPTDAWFLVNGVPFKMYLNSTPKITGFGKVINTHNWEYYEPNEIKLLNVSNSTSITLNITYNQPSTIYVLKLKPENISCVIELRS